MNQYLVFTSNGETLAINIDSIDRILEYIEPNRTPDSLNCILGVVQYSDKVVSLVDLTKKLYNISFTKSSQTKIIVAYLKGNYIGLVVDDIVGIQNFPEEDYETNITNTKDENQYVSGFIKLSKEREDIILIIDILKLFSEDDFSCLETIEEKKII